MARKKPLNADVFGWRAFEKFANKAEISQFYEPSWWPWWCIWRAAFAAGRALEIKRQKEKK